MCTFILKRGSPTTNTPLTNMVQTLNWDLSLLGVLFFPLYNACYSFMTNCRVFVAYKSLYTSDICCSFTHSVPSDSTTSCFSTQLSPVFLLQSMRFQNIICESHRFTIEIDSLYAHRMPPTVDSKLG